MHIYIIYKIKEYKIIKEEDDDTHTNTHKNTSM